MKKLLIPVVAVALVLGGGRLSYASDWDKAGKILTGIEGLRILTGGRIDVVGTMIGATQNRNHHTYKPYPKRHKRRQYAKHYSSCRKRIWVPHYEWETKHVPAHEKYDSELGKVYVEEHYIKYQVEVGGHWERSSSCHW